MSPKDAPYLSEKPMLPFETKMDSIEDFRKNHRKRLKKRFFDGGASAMPDYELLELILFSAIPRQDVKPLSHRLMREFGDFNSVLSASKMRLSSITGVGNAVIEQLKIVEAAAHRLARSKVLHKEVLSSWDALVDYCKTAMGHRTTEQFRILFLDRKNILIADEAQQTGTLDHVPVYPREVAKRALELNASAIILVHNHPSGDPSPSEADITMTKQISAALSTLSITVHDHVIVGKNDFSSFHSLGLL